MQGKVDILSNNDEYKNLISNIISYFAHKIPQLTKTKLYKLLFYLDTKHLKQTGIPVTNLEYEAWQYGPVPQKLYIQIENKSRDFEKYFKINTTENSTYIISTEKYDVGEFTPRQLRIMNELIKIYKNTTVKIISEASHQHGGSWDKTIREKGKNAIIDLTLEIDEDDPVSVEEAKHSIKVYKEFDNRYV